MSHFIFSRLNWSQGILIHLLSQPGLILSNQQIHMIDNYSNQKDEGYDGRGVGNSCLLLDISFEVILTKSSEYKETEIEPCLQQFLYALNPDIPFRKKRPPTKMIVIKRED